MWRELPEALEIPMKSASDRSQETHERDKKTSPAIAEFAQPRGPLVEPPTRDELAFYFHKYGV